MNIMANLTTKQVIVMRKDLNMRKGKMIAQGSHASLSFLKDGDCAKRKNELLCRLTDAEVDWFYTGTTKICVSVNSEAELKQIFENAVQANIKANYVLDAGRTEFDGVPTLTCLALGPDYSDKIDKITGHLQLL